MPLYCILSNATLTELARCRPTTREELQAVKGIGPVKAERYGHTLLEIIGEAATERERGRGGEGETRREQTKSFEIRPPSPRSPSLPISPSPHLSLSSRPLDPPSARGRFHGGRVHGDSRPDARGRLGTRPADRARFGRSRIVGGDSRRRSGRFRSAGDARRSGSCRGGTPALLAIVTRIGCAD